MDTASVAAILPLDNAHGSLGIDESSHMSITPAYQSLYRDNF